MNASTGKARPAQSARESWPWRRLTVLVDGDRYIATVSEGPANWSAHIARLPGLVVTGPSTAGRLDTEDVRKRLSEAARFHLGA